MITKTQHEIFISCFYLHRYHTEKSHSLHITITYFTKFPKSGFWLFPRSRKLLMFWGIYIPAIMWHAMDQFLQDKLMRRLKLFSGTTTAIGLTPAWLLAIFLEKFFNRSSFDPIKWAFRFGIIIYILLGFSIYKYFL